eukprot:TRINITY_DN424_c0_g1_i8.p1 TRINITY_DN424_c0_g1~~TRINITY_DN424_c0_g1_i8.p1  ORF type:complete len:192 (-),score=5.72 TRINITY_DN424_c0_g1_i8:11-586(-)
MCIRDRSKCISETECIVTDLRSKTPVPKTPFMYLQHSMINHTHVIRQNSREYLGSALTSQINHPRSLLTTSNKQQQESIQQQIMSSTQKMLGVIIDIYRCNQTLIKSFPNSQHNILKTSLHFEKHADRVVCSEKRQFIFPLQFFGILYLPSSTLGTVQPLSLIHISEPTRLGMISYAVFCLKKKKTKLIAI